MLSRMDALARVTSIGQKVISQPEKYLEYPSDRGVDNISGA